MTEVCKYTQEKVEKVRWDFMAISLTSAHLEWIWNEWLHTGKLKMGEITMGLPVVKIITFGDCLEFSVS